MRRLTEDEKRLCRGKYSICNGTGLVMNGKNACERCIRNASYVVLYGITVDDYETMLEQQNGGCAVCGGTIANRGKNSMSRLHVDHDHDTGRVRGLLCHPCNTGIAKFRDDPALLRSAADYIERGTSLPSS